MDLNCADPSRTTAILSPIKLNYKYKVNELRACLKKFGLPLTLMRGTLISRDGRTDCVWQLRAGHRQVNGSTSQL